MTQPRRFDLDPEDLCRRVLEKNFQLSSSLIRSEHSEVNAILEDISEQNEAETESESSFSSSSSSSSGDGDAIERSDDYDDIHDRLMDLLNGASDHEPLPTLIELETTHIELPTADMITLIRRWSRMIYVVMKLAVIKLERVDKTDENMNGAQALRDKCNHLRKIPSEEMEAKSTQELQELLVGVFNDLEICLHMVELVNEVIERANEVIELTERVELLKV